MMVISGKEGRRTLAMRFSRFGESCPAHRELTTALDLMDLSESVWLSTLAVDHTETWLVLQDLHHDVLAVTDLSGEVLEWYEYDVHGARTLRDVAGRQCVSTTDEPCASGYGNPRGYTGRWLSSMSGLYDMRARAYDPHMRLWLAPDPLGYVDSFDLWVYVAGDPVNLVDPFGLAAGGTFTKDAGWKQYTPGYGIGGGWGWVPEERHLSKPNRASAHAVRQTTARIRGLPENLKPAVEQLSGHYFSLIQSSVDIWWMQWQLGTGAGRTLTATTVTLTGVYLAATENFLTLRAWLQYNNPFDRNEVLPDGSLDDEVTRLRLPGHGSFDSAYEELLAAASDSQASVSREIAVDFSGLQTSGDAALLLLTYSMAVQGTLEVSPDGSFVFEGTASLIDTYDFNTQVHVSLEPPYLKMRTKDGTELITVAVEALTAGTSLQLQSETKVRASTASDGILELAQ